MKRWNYEGPLMQLLTRMGNLMWLNVLTVVCSLPVITAGPALAALNTQVLKMVRDEDSGITAGFFRSFARNFRQGVTVWLVLLVGFALAGLDYFLALKREILYIRPFLVFVMLVLSGICLYAFPILGRYRNSVWKTIKNALLMSMAQLPKTILMLLCYLLPVGLMWLSDSFVPLWVFFGVSLPAWVSAKLYHPMFLRLEQQEVT